MTRQRDRYQSAFDGDVVGVRSANYDLMLALRLLEHFAKEHELMDERVSFGGRDGSSWSIARLLEIADEAWSTSIAPALGVYLRLQQNAEAARVMADVFPLSAYWFGSSFALACALNNKAIISRGRVTRARRILARRAKDAKDARKTGGAV